MLDLDLIENQINNEEIICPNIIKKLINEIRKLRKENKEYNDDLLAAYMSGRYDGKEEMLNGVHHEH